MAFATRESLLGMRGTQEAVVLQDGTTVNVRSMTGADRDRLEWAITKGDAQKRGRFRAMLVVASVVDEDGNPLFGESDIDSVGQIDAGVLEPIVEAALRVNAFSKDDVEALEGN